MDDLAAVRALAATLPAYDERSALSLGERLRAAGHAPDLVAAALTQARLRARARAKLGALADDLLLTADGLEQATRPEVAAHRARRFAAARAEAGPGAVADLCCGIGVDLLALAAVAAFVVGVERDPRTAAVAAHNAATLGLGERVRVVTGDARDTDLRGVTAVFIDPARRGARGRVFDPNGYDPPLGWALAAAARPPGGGCVKVAPGLPHDRVPDGVEAEWVAHRGDVVEAALWCAALAEPGVRRRATLLPAGVTLVAGPEGGRAPVGPVRRWLHEPAGAAIRAGLVGEVAALAGGTLVDPAIAYLTADAPAATPWTRSWEVLEALPFSVKRLRAVLRARDVGAVVVKKRGSAVEPDDLRRLLRLDPARPGRAVVVLTRVAGAPTALVCAAG